MANHCKFTDEILGPEEVLAELSVAPARWLFGVAMLLSLGALVIYLGSSAPQLGGVARVFLISVGILFVLSGERSRRMRGVSIWLTETRLIDSQGQLLATIDTITGVDRGVMAIKPSNGFLLYLDHKPGRAWVPGLWWRFGRFVGVGGSTQSAAAKFMAELIAMRVAARDLPGRD